MIDLPPIFDTSMIGPDGRLVRFHKGPEPQKPSPTQIALEKGQLNLVRGQLAEMERQRTLATPEAPKPLPALAPGAMQSSADVEQASAAARQQSLRRNAPGRSTIFAGQPTRAVGGNKTLLG